jgi:hypothetical protein
MNKKASAARISGQTVKVYDDRGRNIANIPAAHARSAVANGDSVAVTFEQGNVKIYDANGRHRANIP